jgi:hypothetical protein
VRAAAAPICCDGGSSLQALIRRVPATVVAVRRIATPELFPSDLAEALRALPYEVYTVVASPRAAAEVGVRGTCLGEVLVFVRDNLLARLPDAPESSAGRLVAVLNAGLSPWLGADAAAWDREDGLVASSAQTTADAGEGWDRPLANLPDRSGRA